MSIYMDSKDPQDIKPYFVVWCDLEAGTNTAGDNGRLQGATISTVTWTVPTGITKDSSNQSAVSIKGKGSTVISYSVNTVCTIWLSGGTDGVDYDLLCHVVLSDARAYDQTITIPVRSA